MKRLLMSVGMVGAVLAAGAAVASEPVKLDDGQMDGITAGRLALGFGFTGPTQSFTTRSGSGFTLQGSQTINADESAIQIGANGSLLAASSLSSTTISEAGAGFTTNLTLLLNEGLAQTSGTAAFSGIFNPN